ncbi:MAG: molecular chaperone DnaJ [Rhodospirillaceae bacterium]|nr:molecular chaperone DnaJ [Rhodospirillaceae bacterium]
MAKKDFYEVLGVQKNADGGGIKRAYRKLAMKYHPDRNSGDSSAEQKFKEINEAYDVLKDEQKRSAYDQFGHAAFDGTAGQSAGGFDGGGFADIFEEMFGDFGGRRGRKGPAPGNDLRYNLEITLEDAFRGKETRVRVPTAVKCETCDGIGAASGSKPTNCATCNGQGKVRASQGFFTVERTCPACQGQGQTITDPCKKCKGTGAVRKEKTLSVNIPSGVEDGMRIRLTGEGEAGMRGAPPGDLYIHVDIARHALFQREGGNTYCTVPIPMTTAALGGNVEVPSIDGGRAKVSIPIGTQSGHRLRLRGKGMSVLNDKRRGDMYIELQVETPVNLNRNQKEKLKAFEESVSGRATGSDKPTSPQSEGFFARARELWEDLTD